jgi:hypothetical protein
MKTGSPAAATSSRAGPALRGLPCPPDFFSLRVLRGSRASAPACARVARRGADSPGCSRSPAFSVRSGVRARRDRSCWRSPWSDWRPRSKVRDTSSRPPKARPSMPSRGVGRRRAGRSRVGRSHGAVRSIPSTEGSAMRRPSSRTGLLLGCSIGFGPATSCISGIIRRASSPRPGRVATRSRFGIGGSSTGVIRSSGPSTT